MAAFSNALATRLKATVSHTRTAVAARDTSSRRGTRPRSAGIEPRPTRPGPTSTGTGMSLRTPETNIRTPSTMPATPAIRDRWRARAVDRSSGRSRIARITLRRATTTDVSRTVAIEITKPIEKPAWRLRGAAW